MSLIRANSVQIGQSNTAAQNFTLSVPSTPDGTIKLARGNSGATTSDILTINSSGAISGATINGGTITLGTVQTGLGVSDIDFTNIPSWTKKITVIFNGVRSSTSSHHLIQLGSGSIQNTNYLSYFAYVTPGATGSASSTAGFGIWNQNTNDTKYAHIIITNISGFNWVCSHSGGFWNGAASYGINGGGNVTLSGTLDRLKVTTGGGTWAAGSINTMYEG